MIMSALLDISSVVMPDRLSSGLQVEKFFLVAPIRATSQSQGLGADTSFLMRTQLAQQTDPGKKHIPTVGLSQWYRFHSVCEGARGDC